MKKVVALLFPSLVAHGAPDPELYFDYHHNMHANSLGVVTPLNMTVTELLSYPCSHIAKTEVADTLELEKQAEPTPLLERKGTTSMMIEVENTDGESSTDTTEVPNTGKKSSRAPDHTADALFETEKGVFLKWTLSNGNVQKKERPKSNIPTRRQLQYRKNNMDVDIMTAVLIRIQGKDVVSQVTSSTKRFWDKECVHSVLRKHIVSLGDAESPLFADLTDAEKRACFRKKPGRRVKGTQNAAQININNLLD